MTDPPEVTKASWRACARLQYDAGVEGIDSCGHKVDDDCTRTRAVLKIKYISSFRLSLALKTRESGDRAIHEETFVVNRNLAAIRMVGGGYADEPGYLAHVMVDPDLMSNLRESLEWDLDAAILMKRAALRLMGRPVLNAAD